MSTPEVVGHPAQTAAMTLTAALAQTLRCPICDAQPGEPCEDAVRGWIRPLGPHFNRIGLAKGVI